MVITGSSSIPNNKDVIYVSSSEEEDTSEWLSVLLQTKFWWPCKDHWEEHRGEMSMLCLNCYEVVCPHCTLDESGHRLLKVRRYAYRSVVLVKDMHDLDLDTDVSGIEKYMVNSQKGVHLRPVRRSPQFRPGQGARRCSTCYVWLRNKPLCSLACKENADTSLGDFSETEADRKHRHQSRATSPYRILSMVLALPAQPQPIGASPLEDQRDTDMPEAEHGYEQVVVVDVLKPPPPSPQQPDAPLAPAAEAPSPEQLEEPLAPVAESPSLQQLEAPPAPVADQHHLANHPVSMRRRPRKMKPPVRAPFF